MKKEDNLRCDCEYFLSEVVARATDCAVVESNEVVHGEVFLHACN